VQVAVRAKLDREKEARRQARALAAGTEVPREPSALDRFRRKA
jgi:U3 small nucleolar RNA-associated protein 7